MPIKLFSGALYGIKAVTITIEVNMMPGIKFILVGLPDNAVRESQQRVDSALRVAGYHIPGKRIVINMAPADLKKEGATYDLPLALGILAADGRINAEQLSSYMVLGELSLDGTLQPLRGALPLAKCALDAGIKKIIMPLQNVNEAAAIQGVEVFGASCLSEVIRHFQDAPLKAVAFNEALWSASLLNFQGIPDFKEVRGQERVKRAMEIAAAGGHNMLMVGPPGSGKSMLAKCLPSILPQMTLQEAIEVTTIHSVAGKGVSDVLMPHRPFRAPHHSISNVALIGGGGQVPLPGEISLAHLGVLFLDEFTEFHRTVLEVMRQPLEERHITITRARFNVVFPANVMLIAAMNPCPCGFFNHPTKPCTCTPYERLRYISKISGPLLDRIDIHIEIQPVEIGKLTGAPPEETSQTIRQRVEKARAIQRQRFTGIDGMYCNAQIEASGIARHCRLTEEGGRIIKKAATKFDLSARVYHRILKLSRTIADLDGSPEILPHHLIESIQYRVLEKDGWNK